MKEAAGSTVGAVGKSLTCFTTSQDIHEGGLASTTAAYKSSQDTRPEAATAVVQQLQDVLAIDHCCFWAQLLRVSGHTLYNKMMESRQIGRKCRRHMNIRRIIQLCLQQPISLITRYDWLYALPTTMMLVYARTHAC